MKKRISGLAGWRFFKSHHNKAIRPKPQFLGSSGSYQDNEQGFIVISWNGSGNTQI